MRNFFLARCLARVTWFALLCSSCALGPPRIAVAELTTRAIFVDRFDYTASSESNITSIINNAVSLGFTDVMFQVRGRGDAFYNGSIYEPKAAAAGSVDPLAVALAAATNPDGSKKIRVHAWMNTIPLWNLDAPPSTSTVQDPSLHPYNAVPGPTVENPGYRVFDVNGNIEPNKGYVSYAMFNPILDATHDHITNVARDIASRYNVDGIHLDYIRYVAGNNFDRLPHDELSHQKYFEDTGQLWNESESNYRDYVKKRITDLVRSIKKTVDAVEIGNVADPSDDRHIDLSASVWRDPDVGENDYMQDYRTWLENDLLDVAMPMIYLSKGNDATYFNANLKNTLNIPTNARVAPIVATYLHTDPSPSLGGGVRLTLGEIQRAHEFGADGVGFYDYPSYSNNYTAAERQRIRDFLDAPTSPGHVIDDFETDEGHFNWAYNASSSSQTFGLSSDTTIERVTTHAQSGSASQLLNIAASGPEPWQLRHNSGIGTMSAPEGNEALPPSGYLGFWLKTAKSGITVRLGVDDPTATSPTALEVGYTQSVIADGQWHLYQWNLVDDARWSNFSNGNGNIDAYLAANGSVWIDSIFFNGAGNAKIYMDTVSHNFNGLLAAASIPGDFNGDGFVDYDDYGTWAETYASSLPLGSGADANRNGIVDAGDYVALRKLMSGAGSFTSSGFHHAVPEPASFWMLVAAALILVIFRAAGRSSLPTTDRVPTVSRE
jgi:uncharacterized lipoprotein YddW (UPF0748 family)